MIYVRSSIGFKRHIVLSNGTGIIDPDYRGELMLSLHNTGSTAQHLEKGMRIAQLVIQPVHRPTPIRIADNEDGLGTTERGTGGIGSTGQ